MSLGYKQVEAALAEVLKVKPDAIKAFRGRLRYLRNLGLPELPTPGSGQRIDYSEDNAFVMLIALELERARLVPRSAAIVAASISRMHQSLRGVLADSGDHDVRIVVTPESEMQWTAVPKGASLDKFLAKRMLPSFSVLNLSICARSLDRALSAAAAR